MGSVIEAHCTCGFKRKMALGGGMWNFTTYCNFPFHCFDCKALFEVNFLKEAMRCSECGSMNAMSYDTSTVCRRKGNPVFYWNFADELGRVLELTDGQYFCPKCYQYTLSFRYIGDWD